MPIEEEFSSGNMICIDNNKLHLQSFGAKK
jgi:hypothetical protein